MIQEIGEFYRAYCDECNLPFYQTCVPPTMLPKLEWELPHVAYLAALNAGWENIRDGIYCPECAPDLVPTDEEIAALPVRAEERVRHYHHQAVVRQRLTDRQETESRLTRAFINVAFATLDEHLDTGCGIPGRTIRDKVDSFESDWNPETGNWRDYK